MMSRHLALKSCKYALFYFPLDNTLEPAKTSQIISGMSNVKNGALVELNWDVGNPILPAKIIALAGNRVRKRRCPLDPDKWFWPVDEWVINLTCPLDK